MMKRAAVLAAILLSGSLAAFADTRSDPPFANPLLDDVVEMTRADIPDTTILAFLRVRRARLEADVTAEDLIALRRAGVHAEIVEYIARQSAVEQSGAGENPAGFPNPTGSEVPEPEATAPPGGVSATPPPAPSDVDGEGPEEADPGDGGLIMGVYDPIPEGGYPCWPPSLAPYECGRPLPVSGGFVARWPGGGRQTRAKSADARRPTEKTHSGTGEETAHRGDGGSGGRGSARSGESGGRGGSSARSSGGSGSGGRSGGGSGRH